MKIRTDEWSGTEYAAEYKALESDTRRYTLAYIGKETQSLQVIDIFCIRKGDGQKQMSGPPEVQEGRG